MEIPAIWQQVISPWWRLAPQDATLVWHALARSEYERPRSMRQQLMLAWVRLPTLQGSRPPGFAPLVLKQLTPRFVGYGRDTCRK